MFKDIKEYIELSREDRRNHLLLEESCIEIGGNSKEFRGMLAHHLKTTIPTRIRTIHLCHACHNDKCSNINHIYWGTAKDNHKDQIENGTYKSFKQRMIDKYGEEKTKEMYKAASSKGGRGNKKK